MVWRPWFVVLSLVAYMFPLAICTAQTGPTPRPEGTLTVAVATFGTERWLPELYPGAEDVVLKPMMENLLSRDVTTGQLIPMLAERSREEGWGEGAIWSEIERHSYPSPG